MPSRLPFLDYLRFLAIFLVLGRHAVTPGTPWNLGGWVGVDLFFTLSGFLVGSILLRGDISFKTFFYRRALKIYPSFYFFLLVTLGIQLYFGALIRPARLLPTFLLYSNYKIGLWGHLWSLSVEEHFYLLLPAFLYLLRNSKRIPQAIVAVMLAVFLFRIVHGTLTVYDDITHTYPTHLRLDSLLCGVLIGYYWVFDQERLLAFSRRYRFALFTVGTLLLLPPFFWELESTEWMSTIGFTTNYLGAACLLCGGLSVNARKNLFSYIGERSYSIYLWHAPVLYWGIASFPSLAPFYFPIAIGVGILFANVVELPIVRSRRRAHKNSVIASAREATLGRETNPKNSYPESSSKLRATGPS